MRTLYVLVSLGLVSSALLFATGCQEKAREASRVTASKDYASAMPAVSAEPALAPGGAGRPVPELNTESYDIINENEFVDSLSNPKSTFSIDVDTASYSNVRRMINDGYTPPKGAVRIEELVNYFDYQYAGPESDEHPFSIHTDIGLCPWEENHQLVRIALKGKTMPKRERPNCNLVFLLDVSGSMNSARKLPLVKQAMRMLVENLEGDDKIAIAVYAGASGLVLPSTSASEPAKIFRAMESLSAGGSTNGGEGIELAYRTAAKNFIEGGSNLSLIHISEPTRPY